MNAEQLNAIKERAAKATPGPWKYSEQYGYLAPVNPQQHVAVICNEISRNNDAEFITTAREDVPALVAEVERLQSEVKKMFHEGYAAGKRDKRKFREMIRAKADENE